MHSIWSSVKIPARPSLNEDILCDVCIIGGGMAGMLTAYKLTSHGIHTVVLEADRIGSGQTAGTTAKITSQHGSIYARLIDQFGMEKAAQYASANQDAVEAFARIIDEENIFCDFERVNAYLFTNQDQSALENELHAAKILGLPAAYSDPDDLPFPSLGAVRFSHQAQFHPMKFLKSIARNVTVYEKSRVLRVEPDAVYTKSHVVRAKHIVFASHYPFINKPGYYFARIHQERSYVIALSDAPKLPGMYVSLDDDGHSFRSAGDYLLIGGANHRTGEGAAGRYNTLLDEAKRLFPGAHEAARWSAQDCITLDGIPFIGVYARSRPGWHVATGFMKWGMTGSMVAATILTDDILKKRNRNASVFRPQRFSTAELPSLARDGAQTVKGLVLGAAQPDMKVEELLSGQGGIVEAGGQKLGAYRDENDRVFFVTTRCPHLGCELAWNADERSWDCPCHGSRFSYDGSLISGPAQKGIEVSPPDGDPPKKTPSGLSEAKHI